MGFMSFVYAGLLVVVLAISVAVYVWQRNAIRSALAGLFGTFASICIGATIPGYSAMVTSDGQNIASWLNIKVVEMAVIPTPDFVVITLASLSAGAMCVFGAYFLLDAKIKDKK